MHSKSERVSRTPCAHFVIRGCCIGERAKERYSLSSISSGSMACRRCVLQLLIGDLDQRVRAQAGNPVKGFMSIKRIIVPREAIAKAHSHLMIGAWVARASRDSLCEREFLRDRALRSDKRSSRPRRASKQRKASACGWNRKSCTDVWLCEYGYTLSHYQRTTGGNVVAT